MNQISYRYTYKSPLGDLLIQGTDKALTGVRFCDDDVPSNGQEIHLPIFQQAIEWLNVYFAGNNPGTIPPLSLQGSSFRLMVWRILQDIPYGCTISYKDIAEEVKRQTGAERMSAQAIGNAVGHNPVVIFIPCHRVIGSDGKLTGYAGGIRRKANLLELEHCQIRSFNVHSPFSCT